MRMGLKELTIPVDGLRYSLSPPERVLLPSLVFPTLFLIE